MGAATAPRRVLVVEDDADVRALLCGVLEDAEYACVPCENGRQALDAVTARMPDLVLPDLVLLDLLLPVLDGWQFLDAY